MSRVCSVFQLGEKWHGISLEIGSKGVEGLEFFPDSSIEELNVIFG